MLCALTMGVAVEIWLRTFSAFPRARLRVGLVIASALVVTAVAVRRIPPGLHPYDELLGIVCPRQHAGSLALFTIVVAAARWYGVPLHPLHRAIAIGYAGYLTVFIAVLSIMGWQEGRSEVYRWCAPLGPAAYLLTEVWWVWSAWRPVQPPRPILARLQPWATSW